ncbi:MAG: hypothetical protein IPG65_17280 [Ottowia sp.]|nr:hypothetical protein [Ottowia sp.]
MGPIANARRRHDARRLRVITGATARSFRPSGEGWRLQVEHTDPSLRDRAQVRCDISTRLLIVCAGTFGSTELLLRARADGLEGLSPTLGTGFSGNGDHLVLLDGTPQPVRAVADEEQAFGARAVGPTITRSLDLRRDPEQACVIQDLAIPGPLRRLFEEVAAYTGMMDRLMRVDRQTYGPNENPPDPNGRCPSAVDHALVLAVIGRDDSAGRLDLPSDGADAEVGTLTVRWPGAGTDPGIDALLERVARLAGAGAAAPDRPTPVLHANPLWRPLPGPVENMLGAARGPLVSVHPLGGCRMGDTVHHGVVDHLGRVFRGDQTDTFAGLVVLDGSIIPVCLGINPALTIATLARRAIRRLRDHHWRFQPAVAGPAPAVDATWPPRPVFRPMPDAQAINPTRFEITERMQARARIAHAGRRTEALVTVELWFRPFTLADVAGRAAERRLEVDPARSRLRVVTWADASEPDASASGKLLLEAPLSGSMQLFAHEASGRWRRTLRASLAWLRNRAVRDLFSGDSLRSLVSGSCATGFRKRSTSLRARGTGACCATNWRSARPPVACCWMILPPGPDGASARPRPSPTPWPATRPANCSKPGSTRSRDPARCACAGRSGSICPTLAKSPCPFCASSSSTITCAGWSIWRACWRTSAAPSCRCTLGRSACPTGRACRCPRTHACRGACRDCRRRASCGCR